MELAEVRVMLEVIKAHEPTLTADNLTAQAWADALVPEIPAAFARQYIARHYSKADAPRLTAGSLNNAWKHSQGLDPTLQALRAASRKSVPMPDWFKEQVQTLGQSKAAGA